MSDSEYGLIVSFTDESESFVHGFEAGQIWAAMQRGEVVDRPVHLVNETVLARMARAQGYNLTWVDADDGCWAHLTAEKERFSRPVGDPIATGRFTVIDGGASDDER